jgi:hypothetical protein
MNLISIDSTRIIFLTQVQRPSGQLYLPDAINKVVERYSFLKAPTPDQALPYTFSVGKFQDSQIAELSLYNDGLIVSSASDSDLLDAFLNDLVSWATKEFAFVQLPTTKPEKFYESSVIVKSTTDLAAPLKPQVDIADMFSKAVKSANIEAPIRFSGAIFDFDVADIKRKRKPFRLIVDRRVGLPFSENIFFSQAPFKTKDHLKVLASLEAIADPANIRRRRV